MGQDVVVEVDATSIGVGLDVERPRPLTKHSVACLSAGFAGSGIRQGQRGRACLRKKEGGATFPPFSGRGLPRSLTLPGSSPTLYSKPPGPNLPVF